MKHKPAGSEKASYSKNADTGVQLSVHNPLGNVMNSENQNKWMAWIDPRHIFRAIFMLDDTPHHIAIGTAVGVFVAMTPTVGVQMLIVLILAGLFKPFFSFNKVAALIAVYISNPLTTIPIYWFSYKLGTVFVSGKVTYEQLSEILVYNNLTEWWHTVTNLLFQMGWPLIIGSLVVATVCSVISYPVMLILARGYQKTSEIIREEVAHLTHRDEPRSKEVAKKDADADSSLDTNEVSVESDDKAPTDGVSSKAS